LEELFSLLRLSKLQFAYIILDGLDDAPLENERKTIVGFFTAKSSKNQ